MRYGMVNAWMHEAHFFKFWLQKTILHALLDYMSKANMNITLPLSKFQRRGHKVTFHALQGLHQLYWGTLWCLWRSDWSFEVSMKACSDCEGKKGRGVGGHGKTFILRSVNHFCVDFEVCFGSLSCWKVQPRPILSLLEGAVRFSFNICWYLMESMIPCILTRCPGPLEEKQPHNIKDPPPYLDRKSVV